MEAIEKKKQLQNKLVNKRKTLEASKAVPIIAGAPKGESRESKRQRLSQGVSRSLKEHPRTTSATTTPAARVPTATSKRKVTPEASETDSLAESNLDNPASVPEEVTALNFDNEEDDDLTELDENSSFLNTQEGNEQEEDDSV